MNLSPTYTGQLSVSPQTRFGLVVTRWNQFVVNQLEAGAIATLQQHGATAAQITRVQVPGAFEIPLVLDKLAAQGRYDALIALGAVIRGGTPHFDYVAGECVSGISQTMRRYGLPVSFGVLTVDNLEQAIERAGSKAGNKGSEAAACAIEMVNLLQQLDTAN
jgi:6,7-dimethyl-8-ribityllumazine synthase